MDSSIPEAAEAVSMFSAMPSYATLITVLFLCGVISYGVTQVLKIPFRKVIGADLEVTESDPVWWQFAFRVLPLIIGAAAGSAFIEWPWGVSIGLSGAILNVLLYRQTTSIIKKFNPLNQ
jgi:hypothetical protein